MFCGRFILILLVILPMVLTQTNYCDKNLCAAGKKHVACNNNGAFQAACGRNPQVITMTPALRKQILDKHNKLRNQIAKGFGKFKPAMRMATIRWNPELAKLAELNVKQCRMQHDQCRNTKNFKYAGQNLATMSWKGMQKSVSSVVNSLIQNWFDEYKDCTMAYINKYPTNTNGKVIGHFTAMIQEKATYVGCALVKHLKSNGFTEQLLACNYSFTNILGRPVYRAGTAASQCQTGVNPNYKFLCSVQEKYNVNVA